MKKLFTKWFQKSSEKAPALSRFQTEIKSRFGAIGKATSGLPNMMIYEEMMLDPLVKSAMMVKKLGCLAMPWKITAAKNDTGQSEFIQNMFDDMDGSVNGLLFDALDALSKGFSVLEKIWTQNRFGQWVLHSAKPKDPALFSFETDRFLNLKSLRLHLAGEEPIVLPKEKFILFAHNQKYGAPEGESDLKSAYKHWKIKRELVNQWSAHLEKFASPTVVGKFKRGMPEESQISLLDSLDKLQRQSAVVHPDDVEVSLLDGARQGQNGYLEAIDYQNREIARSILGQTLTTEDSRRIGSLALGKVHLQVLIMQLAGLRNSLAERVMNEQVIRPLIEINFGAGAYPVFKFDEPELDVFRTGRVV